MVVDYLEEIVLAVLEDHEDGFVLEDDLDQVNQVWVG